MNNSKKIPAEPRATEDERMQRVVGYTSAFRKYSEKLEKKSQSMEAGKLSECIYRLLQFNAISLHCQN